MPWPCGIVLAAERMDHRDGTAGRDHPLTDRHCHFSRFKFRPRHARPAPQTRNRAAITPGILGDAGLRVIEAAKAIARRLDPLRRRWFLRLLKWAQDSAPLREDSIADLGLGYPLLRKMLAELGRRFAETGAIETP